jgi:hypothetical protein
MKIDKRRVEGFGACGNNVALHLPLIEARPYDERPCQFATAGE